MKQMHDGQIGGHFDMERTVAWLQTRYFWYRMREDMALWCSTCTSCASKARPRKTPQAPMGTVRVGAPMERIALDIMGPLNETDRKNSYVLVVQDYFTKWVEAYPLPNQQALTVAEVLASEAVGAGYKPYAGHKVVISHRRSVLGFDDLHVRECRLTQIGGPKKCCQVQGTSSEVGILLFQEQVPELSTGARCCAGFDVNII
ncbi:hypothetical protein NHX12_032608 [Muraenolepis orangiensis]|uniref:Integrase zinc-binding domain-containing protein n=1 Tax=Muraenolepis orangiensis TaxID=630683 RepID=A0A9Q0EA38_9TELE|nr:hypothetical protein NHX12_032608 [Muraenolepis orangiensis]